MLVGHAVFVGHVIGRHVVDTKEPNGLAVNADLILALENRGEFSFCFRLQAVYGHSVSQPVYKNTVFVETDRYITVSRDKWNAETEIVSLIGFLFNRKVRKRGAHIYSGTREANSIGGQISILIGKAQSTQLTFCGVIPVNEFVGATFYQHDRAQHGVKGLRNHICAALFVELGIVDSKPGNGGIVSQVRHTEPLLNGEIAGRSVEHQIGKETAV